MINEYVTIILTTYNDGKRVKRAIKSVINQTYKKWELIIINDASTDKTLSYIKEFQDSRITIINNKHNLGLSLSRNRGLNIAKGEYLAFLDADDRLGHNFLQCCITSLNKENSDVAVSDIKTVTNNKYKIIKCRAAPFESYPSVWNKVYKRKLWDGEFFNKERYIEDFPVTPFILLKARKISKAANTYYYYYQYSTSLVHSQSNPCDQLKIVNDVKYFINRLNQTQLADYNYEIMKYINYQLSEHFWKGMEDSENTENVRKLFITIASYSKKLNMTLFHNNCYFYSDTLYHRFRNLAILPLLSFEMYKFGMIVYHLLLKIKEGRKAFES